MWTATHIEKDGLNHLKLSNQNGSTKADFCISQGGRLDKLIINNESVLANFPASTYDKYYASAILFPFANRIKNGEYEFEGSTYNFECNEVGNNNALHGTVYNKPFVITETEISDDAVSVTLSYKEEERQAGFPYKFVIDLVYTLNEIGLSLAVSIRNEDKSPFPFTLGWHPYFQSSDIAKSTLSFDTDTHFSVDNRQNVIGKLPFQENMPMKLSNRLLDDGFNLLGKKVKFKTPEFTVKLNIFGEHNYLQLFTPEGTNAIAIEPMTGVADSFNNKIGLRTLAPNEKFYIRWEIILDSIK